ncbi:MAG: ferrous iron transport protein [Candidatus Atribacteria bacterium]|nr:ferrous iron transport protein [Candidatus Atribacteria bacterium]
MDYGNFSRKKSHQNEFSARPGAGGSSGGKSGVGSGQGDGAEGDSGAFRAKKIVLAGNPNVGKSVIFTQLSGTYAVSSNYPGTTVDYLKSTVKKNGSWFELIDAPGTYALLADAEAERIAEKLIEEGDVIVNVVDATNLERNLYLTFELLEKRKPMILVLNMWDEAKKRGVEIDLKALEEALGVPTIPVVATTGEGIKELLQALEQARVPHLVPQDHEKRWEEIGNLIEKVQFFSYRKTGWVDLLYRATISPVGGLFIGIGVLLGSFFLVRLIGEGIINYVFGPLFDWLYLPLLEGIDQFLSFSPFLQNILIGQKIEGAISLEESLGVLSTGVYIPLGVVLPYILAFYLVLGLLEDVGYLPRLAVLLDGVFHRFGLHGYAIVPTLLGLGCNVPGVLATRVLESEIERFIVATLISVAVPCAAQQALIVGVLGDFGIGPVILVYFILFLVWLTVALILKRAVPGYRPALVIEIPPYRLPYPRAVISKLWMRARGFLREALPIVFLGVLGVNLLYTTQVFSVLAEKIGPSLSQWLGLPGEAILVLFLGFLRKDLAMGLLLPLGLSIKQLVIASVMLAMFFPCVATFVIILRELGGKRLLQATGIMVTLALLVGGLLNIILPGF